MKSDPKLMTAIERIDTAQQKVDEIKSQRLQLERDIIEARKQQRLKEIEESGGDPELQASLRAAELEEQAAQNRLEAAELEQELLGCERLRLRSDLSQMAERIESGKSAAVSCVGGLIGLTPTVLVSEASNLAKCLDVGTGCITCALLGVLYRYVVASDPENAQIRGGAVAAFGLTRGLVMAQSAILAAKGFDLQTAASAALPVGQSMLMVAFAAGAIEAATKAGWVERLGAAAAKEEALLADSKQAAQSEAS